MKPEYISLHTHSEHSILDGYSSVEAYIEEAQRISQKGIGLTDHGSVSGIYPLLKAAEDSDFTTIPGCEFYLAPINPLGAKVQKPVYYGKGQKIDREKDVAGRGAYTHMTIWAYNNAGLKNLFKLSSMSFHPENYYVKQRIDFNMLAEHSEGLVAATGCPSSEISTRFRLGQDAEAYEYAGRLKEIFGPERLFVEIMDHSMKKGLERDLLRKQVRLSKEMGLPLLATNDAHYARKTDAPRHEEMLAVQSKARMSELPIYEVDEHNKKGTRFAFEGSEYYLKTLDEMSKIFPQDDFPNALSNSLRIAEMTSDIHLDFDPFLRPAPIVSEGKSEVEVFKDIVQKGLKWRYGNASPEVKKQAVENIKKELPVFISSDYVGYMLVVYEYLNWTRENYATKDSLDNVIALPLGGGRGSVGGSTVAYVMGIHEVDPIRHDLIFERFLSAGRGSVYKIKYDDGTSDELIASDEVIVLDADGKKKKKYTHQIVDGDQVISVVKDN